MKNIKKWRCFQKLFKKMFFLVVCFRPKQDLCFFCDQIFDGNVKLIFTEPPFKCHPDCLKVRFAFLKQLYFLVPCQGFVKQKNLSLFSFQCSVCSKNLGDLLTPIFSREQIILCDYCFSATLWGQTRINIPSNKAKIPFMMIIWHYSYWYLASFGLWSIPVFLGVVILKGQSNEDVIFCCRELHQWA